ncbi:MAG: TetR/AcrR family transcriptional regulator [Maritimibacter sp.]
MTKDTSRLTVESWIQAGFRALTDAGPTALKAEPLARALGTTKGSFYWHFKDVSDFKKQMIAHWQAHAFEAVTAAVDDLGPPTARLYKLGELATDSPEAYGGAAAEPAIRAWAQSDHTVAQSVRLIDEKRLEYLSGLLRELDLTNPDFARIIYGAYIGMGTLSAADDADNADAMSTLMAAILALRDA